VLPQQAAEFTAYGATHLGAVVVMLAGAVGLVLAARCLDDPTDRLGRTLAVVILMTTLPLQVLYFTPEHWSLQRSLPIQLCDVATLAAAYALWTHRWWAVGLTYYWGLTLTTQAIATPDLRTPFPEPIFLLYWAMHIGTVWAAVHLTWGRGLVPDWRSYRLAMAATTVWAVLITVANAALGTNYGYLNEKPRAASILDLLGPWPVYVVAEALLIAGGWALVTWPWVALRRRRALPAATP
jgi:hypothetical integral membrane protein (TIGR02206 family)